MKLSDKTYFSLFIIIILAALLRFMWLDKIPSSLYSDETDQGYNAYSIMLTGKDEHGVHLPVSLRSFGDWKPPLPSYLMIPFVRLLGLSEVSVRLPSAILGLFTIILIFYLTRVLLREQENRTKIALLSSYFLAISPWHILQSRAAMLIIVGLFFLTLGVYTFFKSIEKKTLIFISAFSFALSVYSYYGLRIVAPAILLALLIRFRKNVLYMKKEFILSAIFGLILLLPLLLSFKTQPDVVLGRARTVSIFYDQGVNLRKWELTTQDGISADTSVTRFFHNNFYMYSRSIIQRFLSHLDISYLLFVGDGYQPFQIPQMGILYIPDLLFILLGLLVLYKYKYRDRSLIVYWVFASIIPAAFTFVTPASNRTFNAVVPYMVLAAIGIVYAVAKIQKKVFAASFLTAFYIFSFGYFMHQYFIDLPTYHADWWNYGWKQVVEYVNSQGVKYKNIVVPEANGMPYVYFLFYQKYPPEIFQNNAIRPYMADRFGFENVEGFDKYLFPSEFDWNFIKRNNLQKNSLYIIPAYQAADDKNYLKAIYYPNGKIAFKIFAYE